MYANFWSSRGRWPELWLTLALPLMYPYCMPHSLGLLCTGAAKKVDPTAINVMTGKSYEQEFDLEQQRMKVRLLLAWHRVQLQNSSPPCSNVVGYLASTAAPNGGGFHSCRFPDRHPMFLVPCVAMFTRASTAE